MKVYHLFSRNQKYGSKLISWASGLLIKDLQKVPSHVAILIEIENVKESLVLESVLESGVRIVPYSCWLKHNEECYRIQHTKSKNLDQIFEQFNEIWNKGYDWMGILYFGCCFIRNFLFKTPFPKTNKWQSKDRFFCTEAAAKLDGYDNYSMTTPAKMCSDLLNSKF